MGATGRRLAVPALVVAAAVAVGALVASWSSGASAPALPGEGLPAGVAAPGFTLPALGARTAGGRVAVGPAAGKPVVIVFFASWCSECRQDLAVLAAGWRAMRGKAEFVGVDVADSPAAALSMVRSAGIGFPVGIDRTRDVSGRLYHLIGLPSAVFVDGGGRVVGTILGPLGAGSLRSWVERAAAG